LQENEPLQAQRALQKRGGESTRMEVFALLEFADRL
jgi:hypothetical protein